MTPKELARRNRTLVAAYRDDIKATYRGLGRRFHISGERVRQLLRRAGVPPHRPKRRLVTCAACKERFQPGSTSALTCSPACNRAYRRAHPVSSRRTKPAR